MNTAERNEAMDELEAAWEELYLCECESEEDDSADNDAYFDTAMACCRETIRKIERQFPECRYAMSLGKKVLGG